MRSESSSAVRASPLFALLFCACAGGGGGSKPAGNGFELVTITVAENAVWKINRPIEFRFSLPVDFLSVSSNTINIRTAEGIPATGSFELKRIDLDGDGVQETAIEDTVVFYPSCPVRPDYSDAGLIPGGVRYIITIAGSPNNSNSVRSTDQRALTETRMRSFTTPNSSIASIVFVDPVPGGPVPVTRPKGGTQTEEITYVEIGKNSDAGTRVFFEFDATTQIYDAVAGTKKSNALLPLNLYSDPSTSAAVVISFNQAVNPSATNISDARLRLEYQDSMGDWLAIDTRVELIANCAGSGATVRLEPIGVLPSATKIRAIVLPGFEDIVGDYEEIGLDEFAVASTTVLNYPTLTDPTVGADEFFESFQFGGENVRSFEDEKALFDTPAASWKDGRLTSAFDFEGTGGPGGDFDWRIKKDEIFLFDTRSSSIVGGPGGIATTTQFSIDGVVDVRNLVIERGGVLRVQGQLPMLINATGTVRIDGVLDVSGFSAKMVVTLNSGHQPEPGGAGAAGGGSGGAASSVTTSSTRVGDTGDGPAGEKGTGGRGGESGYSKGSFENRRPGGGGGGRFAPHFDLQYRIGGRYAQNGYNGSPQSSSCVTRKKPAKGGLAGVGPFRDGDSGNDFFGIKPVISIDSAGKVTLVDLVRGELSRLWAGYGAGGGGDALPSSRFPTPGWTPRSDEKGGGGGGGAGSVRIRALGAIFFGTQGLIASRGGGGGSGENVAGNNHIGGTGGSGSGGHVMLESAVRIDLASGVPANAARVHIDTRGGARSTGLVASAPLGVSYGGGGGVGIIQLHVPSINPASDDPMTSDIIVPTQALSDPDPFMRVTSSTAVHMIPTFSARSKARSRWIPLGGANFDASGAPRQVKFLFGGVQTEPDTDDGKIATVAERVPSLPPILGPELIASGNISILADEVTLRIQGASVDPLRNSSVGGVANDIYLRTPALLKNFRLRLEDANDLTNSFDFDVVSAQFDESSGVLELLVEDRGVTLKSFADGTVAQYSLIPRFFRVRTGADLDVLRDSAFVRITFEGAGEDEFGRVDETNLLVPATGDLAKFNALAAGDLKFFRFEIEFDLDADGGGLSKETEPVTIDFVRLPFRF